MAFSSTNLPNRIRDPVHGFIHLSDSEMRLIDRPEFQRLRRIRQLAFTSLVYPGAVHTRFEHSLGVLELATRMFEHIEKQTEPEIWHEQLLSRLKIEGLDRDKSLQVLRLAALLHDIGHLPFSHAGEGILPSGQKHEHLSVAIARSLTKEIDSLFFDGATEKAVHLINPDGMESPTELLFLRGLVSGQIDADRCDYLLRDSLYCGVSYGRFDVERLIESLCMVSTDEGMSLGIGKGGLHAVEALIFARYYMFSQVYFHRTRRLFDHYVSEYLPLALPQTVGSDPLAVLEWDDYRVLDKMRSDANRGDPASAASMLWFRGAASGKHTVIYESSQSPGRVLENRVRNKVEHIRDECPDYQIFLDAPRGKIHEFHVEESEEQNGHLLWVTDRRMKRPALITRESTVIRSIPRRFSLVRAYAYASQNELEQIKERLGSVEGA